MKPPNGIDNQKRGGLNRQGLPIAIVLGLAAGIIIIQPLGIFLFSYALLEYDCECEVGNDPPFRFSLQQLQRNDMLDRT